MTSFAHLPVAQVQDRVPIPFERGATDIEINGTMIGSEFRLIEFLVPGAYVECLMVALDNRG